MRETTKNENDKKWKKAGRFVICVWYIEHCEWHINHLIMIIRRRINQRKPTPETASISNEENIQSIIIFFVLVFKGLKFEKK